MAQQWTSKGIDALNTGRISQAKSWFTRAAAENPESLATQVNLARVFRKEGNLPKAIEHMQQGVELSPQSDPSLLTELGEMYLEAGQRLPAKRLAELSLQRDHRFAAAWALQGHVHRANGDSLEALASYHRAVSLEPKIPGVQLAIAQVYQETREPLRALSAVEQYLQSFPSDQQPEIALLTKGQILLDLNQEKTAVEVFQTAAAKDDATTEAFIRLSEVQWSLGQNSEAQATLIRGREIHTQSVGKFNSILAQLETAQEAQDRVAHR